MLLFTLGILGILGILIGTTSQQGLIGVNISGLPTCAQACLESNTGAATGCAITDVQCLCSSISYINALSCCLVNTCDEADQKSALEFDIELCQSYNVSIPDFLGCSPLNNATSSSYSLLSTAAIKSALSAALLTAALTAANPLSILTIEPAFTTAAGGPIATFKGTSILTGSCNEAQIVSATVGNSSTISVLDFLWVGCSDQQPGCCPFNLEQVGPLSICPADYTTTSGACCPSGWSVLNSTLVPGQTPCFISQPLSLIPTITFSSTTGPPTSLISTELYSLRYTLAPTRSVLSTGAKVGIAVCIVFAILLGLAFFLSITRYRRRRLRARRANAVPIISEDHQISPVEKSQYSPGAPPGDGMTHPPIGRTDTANTMTTIPELPSPSDQEHRSPQSPQNNTKVFWSPTSSTSMVSTLSNLGSPTRTARVPVQFQSRVAEMPAAPVPMELEGSTFINEHHPAYTSGVPDNIPPGGLSGLVGGGAAEAEGEREVAGEDPAQQQQQEQEEEVGRRPRVGTGPTRVMPESPEEVGRGF